MGLFIIFAIVATISFFFMRYTDKHLVSDGVEFGSMLLFAASAAIVIAIPVCIIMESCTINHTIDQLNYERNVIQSLVDNADPTNFTDENILYLRATDFNKDLRDKQYWGHNFFTIYLCSPRYTEVPLVTLPYEAS